MKGQLLTTRKPICKRTKRPIIQHTLLNMQRLTDILPKVTKETYFTQLRNMKTHQLPSPQEEPTQHEPLTNAPTTQNTTTLHPQPPTPATPGTQINNSTQPPPQHTDPLPADQTMNQATPQNPTKHKNRNLKVQTLNIRGLNRNSAEAALLLRQEHPDIMVLTETKLKPKQTRAAIGRLYCHNDYEAFHTANSTGTGGVTILIHKRIALNGDAQALSNYTVTSHLLSIHIQLPISQPFIVTGAHLPCSGSKQEQRTKCYQQLAALHKEFPQAIHIHLGDWNTPLHNNTNMEQQTQIDKQYHHAHMTSENMQLLTNPSRPTYRHGTTTTTSTIDGIYITKNYSKALIEQTTNLEHGLSTDHAILQTVLSLHRLDMQTPPPLPSMEHTQTQSLHTKYTKEQAEQCRLQLRKTLATELTQLTQLTTLPGQATTTQINAALPLLTTILNTGLNTAMQICGTLTKTKGGRHFLPKTVKKDLNSLNKARKQVQHILAKTHADTNTVSLTQAQLTWMTHMLQDCHTNTDLTWTQKLRHQLNTAPHDTEMATTTHNTTTTLEMIHTIHTKLNKYRDEILANHKTHSAEAAQKRFQETWKRKQSLATSQATGKKKDTVELEALKDKTGKPTTDPEKINEIITDYYTRAMQPIGGLKDMNYKDHLDSPWLQADAPDRMTRLATTTNETTRAQGLTHYIDDLTMFKRLVRTSSRHKTPGPDDIPNEVFLLLPDEAITAIHDLFKHMWRNHYTPDQWKESVTILLYKKNSKLELGNYRPIALANTLYKLWTRFVQPTASRCK